MDSLTSYIVTGFVMLVVGLLLRELEPKVKIVYWSPHYFFFQVTQPKVDLLTQSITVQNTGRRRAEEIEIVHKKKPDFFKLQPALDYEEDLTPAGEHVIRVKSLGPKEFFTIQFLSYATVPELQYVRSTAGHAQLIQTQFQRVFPRWFNAFVVLMMLIGIAFVVYWMIQVGVFILKGAGALGG